MASRFGVIRFYFCFKIQRKMVNSHITNLKRQSGGFNLENTSVKMSLAGVFNNRSNSYLNEFTLFVAHFNTIPKKITEEEVDCEKLNNWLVSKYSTEIKECYFNKRYFKKSKEPELDDIFYFLYEDLLIYIDIGRSEVHFLFHRTEVKKVEEIISEVRRFKVKRNKKKPEILLIIHSSFGIDTKKFKISHQKVNINENYNDDFVDVHRTILNRLLRIDDKGLVLLHGRPGTGKTSYIRFLLSLVKKKVIFLPPNMASSITNPDLITILIDNPNSIFIIEDAERIIVDRNKEEQSPVSALLNISDGLLSDCLNIQVICTFNTDISMIDNALMRKGRLIARYEFKELTIEKSRRLSEKIGFNSEIDTPMTLSSIYNQSEMDFIPAKKRNQLGFITT